MGYSHSSNLFPKPLEAEEEAEYIELLYNGDEKQKEEARNILIEHNLRLVAHIAKKYASASIPADDLISVGTIGLIKAISTFRAEKGNRLGTYAVRCIENEMLMYMRSSKKYGNEISINDPVGTDKEGNEIDMRQNFDDEETGFDMRDVAGTETVANENELLNDYTIKDADAGFDDPSVLEDDNSAAAESASDEVNIDE